MDNLVRSKRSPSEASVHQLLDDQDFALSCGTDWLLRFADSNSEDDFRDQFYLNGMLRYRVIESFAMTCYITACILFASWNRLQGIEFWITNALLYVLWFLLSFAPILKRRPLTRWFRPVPSYALLTSLFCYGVHCVARVRSGMSFPDVNLPSYVVGVYLGMRVVPFDLVVLTCPIFPLTEFIVSGAFSSWSRASIQALPCICSTSLLVWAIRWLDWHIRCNFLLQMKLQNMTPQLEEKRRNTDQILANILPHQIIDAYVRGDRSFNRSHESCTVVFVKLLLPPLDVTNVHAGLARLNEMVSLLEDVCAEYGIEKVKTIGMTFMAVSGVPVETADHVQRAACFALEATRKVRKCGHSLQIGLHCGPVVTGVVGAKIVWDVWGDTVNLSSRMCVLSQPNCIQVSPDIKAHLAGDSQFLVREAPSKVNVKGKGLMQTYTLVDSWGMDDDSSLRLPVADACVSSDSPREDEGEGIIDPLHVPLPCQAARTTLPSCCSPLQVRSLPSLVKDLPESHCTEASASIRPLRTACNHLSSQAASFFTRTTDYAKRLTCRRMARLFAKHVLLQFPPKFADKEKQYWQQQYETSAAAMRQCLLIMLIQTAVNASVEAHNNTLNRFWNILLRYCLFSALILVMLRLTYMPLIHSSHARWITNLFLVLLTVLMCVKLWIDWSWFAFSYQIQEELTGDALRMYTVMDAFFLSLVISLFPNSRLTDNFLLQVLLVGLACGVCIPPDFAVLGMSDIGVAMLICWLKEKENRKAFMLKQQQLEINVRIMRETRTIQRLLQGCMPITILKEIQAAQLGLVGNFRVHDSVVVLATDLAGFTLWSSGVGAEMVVAMLDKLVSAMDSLVDKHHLSKIKTIGDAYLAVAGLGGLDSSQLTAMAEFALDVQRLSQTFEAPDGSRMHMRIGVAIGSAAAGIIGTKKWFWDLWGQAVMHAEDLEKTGHVNEIHISKEISVMFARLGYRIQQQDTISYGPVSDATSVTNGTCVLVGGRGTLDMKTIEPDKKGG